jgi:hypothetical protein
MSVKALLLFAIGLAPALLLGQSYPPSWTSTSHYAVGDQVQVNGNIYRAIKAVTTSNINPTTNYTYWELYYVRSNTTLTIGTGQTFPTLVAAWDYSLNAKVADGAYLHLYISSAKGNFSESFTAPFLLDHSSGARMAIIGDNAANDVLSFSATGQSLVNGLVIDTGHSFNTLDGFTLFASSNGLDGIKADFQANISSVADVVINGFSNCVHVQQGAGVFVLSSCTFENFTNYGLYAETSGSIVSQSGLTLNGLGTVRAQACLFADMGGEVVAVGCNLENAESGAQAVDNGSINVSQATIQGSYYGCYAFNHGFIEAEAATISSSQADDLIASLGGYIDINGASFLTQSYGGSADGSYILPQPVNAGP